MEFDVRRNTYIFVTVSRFGWKVTQLLIELRDGFSKPPPPFGRIFRWSPCPD